MIILILAFFIFTLLFLLKKRTTILYVPLIFQLVDIGKILIPNFTFSSEAVYLEYLTHFFVLALFILQFRNTDVKFFKKFLFLFIFIFYIWCLIYFSTDVFYSFKRVLSVTVSLLSLPAAYTICTNNDNLDKVLKGVWYLIVAFIINTVLCTIFRIGPKMADYGFSFIYWGSVNFYSGYGFALALILLPLIKMKFPNSIIGKTYSLLLLISFIILILLGKRSYIFIPAIGLFTYYLINRKFSLQLILPIITFLFLTFTLFSGIFQTIYSKRTLELSRTFSVNKLMTEEGRFVEYTGYIETVQFKNDTKFLLFGEEIFNSKGKYSIFANLLGDKERILHSDFTNILFGCGIVGISLYLLIFINLGRQAWKNNKKNKMNLSFPFYNSALWAFILALFFNGFTDGNLNAVNRIIPFFIIGALLGITSHQRKLN